jgi:4-diphosphocytidyl-2-C-methyl-D-erythritol kinase
MTLDLLAPAKVNLTLEVLGRRPDGYHEITSVMQTIDLVDRVRLDPAASLTLELAGDQTIRLPDDPADNLVMRAVIALRQETGLAGAGARIVLEKHIPAGMGLGGGSSDAAAVLRGLNRLWRLGLNLPTLARIAARIGSDVPFFLHGGTASISGRGEIIEPLPDPTPFDLTLFVCGAEIEDKTQHAYARLAPADFSDGARTHAITSALCRGEPLTTGMLVNVFDRVAGDLVPAMGQALTTCRGAGIDAMVCGSGPAFFTMMPLEALPLDLIEALEREWGVRAIACRSLARAESLAQAEA